MNTMINDELEMETGMLSIEGHTVSRLIVGSGKECDIFYTCMKCKETVKLRRETLETMSDKEVQTAVKWAYGQFITQECLESQPLVLEEWKEWDKLPIPKTLK